MGLKTLVNALIVLLVEGPAPKGPGLPEQLRLEVQHNPLYQLSRIGLENRNRLGLVEVSLTENARRLFDGMPYSDFSRHLAMLDDALTKVDPAYKRSNPEAMIAKLQQGETIYFALDTDELALLFGGQAGIRRKDRVWLVLQAGSEGTIRVEGSTYRNQAVYS